ncbi:MAG: hypothetical protein J6H18_02815 [Lachnospiraceae bacterium]|nr:hypothetical protein [Lachnospiraceae bacterium]
MEIHGIEIKITTKGEVCELKGEEIRRWYEEKIRGLFDPAYGTPEIEVRVKKREE